MPRPTRRSNPWQFSHFHLKQHYQEVVAWYQDRRSPIKSMRAGKNRTRVPHTTLRQQNVFLPSGNDKYPPTPPTRYFFCAFAFYVVFSLESTCEVSGDLSSRGTCANCVSLSWGDTLPPRFILGTVNNKGRKNENKQKSVFLVTCDLCSRSHLHRLFISSLLWLTLNTLLNIVTSTTHL